MGEVVLDEFETLFFELLDRIMEPWASAAKDIYITGGWVRDKLMGKLSKDIDICVEEALMKPLIFKIISEFAVLKRREGYHLERCIDARTFTVEQEPIKGYEVKVLYLYDNRGDMRSVDIRKLKNDSIDNDVYTRDFTINSLYFSVKDRKVVFPNNDTRGVEDLQNGVMRCVGTPQETFTNSQSRYFRMLRFAVKFGFRIDEDILEHINGLHFKKDIFVG